MRGVAFRIFWIGEPRWLYIPIYVALGWAAVFYAHDFGAAGGTAVVTLVAVGGGVYTIGGLVYGLRKPARFPAWSASPQWCHTHTYPGDYPHRRVRVDHNRRRRREAAVKQR